MSDYIDRAYNTDKLSWTASSGTVTFASNGTIDDAFNAMRALLGTLPLQKLTVSWVAAHD